jgi:hypothetical protein
MNGARSTFVPVACGILALRTFRSAVAPSRPRLPSAILGTLEIVAVDLP